MVQSSICHSDGDPITPTDPLPVAGEVTANLEVGGAPATTTNPVPTKATAARGVTVTHRSGVTAIDKLAAITIQAAKSATVGVMAAVEHKVCVVPRNEYGPVGPSAIVLITPDLNNSIDVTIPPCAGATHYGIHFGPDAAPKWVGTVAETERAEGRAIDAVGHVIAGGSAGKINVRLVGTGKASNDALYANNNAYTPAVVAAAAGTTVIDASGYPRVYLDVELAVDHLGLVDPKISIVGFVKTGAKWYAVKPEPLTLLTTVGYPLLQEYYIDVGGAAEVIVCVGTLAGTGASATITATPGV